MIPPEIYFKKWKHKDFRNSQNHKKPLNSTLVPRPPKHPPPPPKKKQFLTFLWFQGVISCRIKPPKKSFLVFLVEFQVYFTGFLKVYVIVLLLRKYLTSKIEKTFHMGFFANLWTPDLGKKIFTTWNVLKSKVYLTWINFWKFHDHLKACLVVISWPENVKFITVSFFYVFDPLKNPFLN